MSDSAELIRINLFGFIRDEWGNQRFEKPGVLV